MTSQTFFFTYECPSVLNIFLNNFIGHTSFNTSIFFSGLVTGLDPNWDGTEIWLDYYHIDLSLRSSVLLACISISGIFGGLLILSMSSNISEFGNFTKQEVASKDDPCNGGTVDVRYNDPVPGTRNLKFVYDRMDPSGAKLRTLFDGKGYEEHTIGTRRGFLIGAAGRTMASTQPNAIKVAALVSQVTEVEQSAFITSNLFPIDKTFNGRGGVSLKVEKNMDTWI